MRTGSWRGSRVTTPCQPSGGGARSSLLARPSRAVSRSCRSRILCLVPLVILSGCVAVRQAPLPESESSRFAGRTFQRSVYPTPDFAAYTAGKAGFGVIGAALIIRAGNEIIRDNAVEDPAIRLGQELAQSLADRHGLQLLTATPPVAQSDDVTALLQTYGDADLILDIRTINWMFIYFPSDWDNYRVLYSARLRVIDRRQQAVIAEGFCAYKPEYEDTNKAPTREYLVGNNAEGLKQELAKAADYCSAFFRSNTFRT
jgi:hypothetical protein